MTQVNKWNEVVQDPASTGTLWKTMSARIRGAKTELEELGEETDAYTKSSAKLRDLVKTLTGFDIMADENTFRNIYDIILGIGKEWDKLTDIERASLGEALAGKRNANALYAVLGNLETLEDAYKAAENSAGSAYREQENYTKSIQYSIDVFKASIQDLAYNLIQSKEVKSLVDQFAKLINTFSDSTDVIEGTVTIIIELLKGLGGILELVSRTFKETTPLVAASVGVILAKKKDILDLFSKITKTSELLSTLRAGGAIDVGKDLSGLLSSQKRMLIMNMQIADSEKERLLLENKLIPTSSKLKINIGQLSNGTKEYNSKLANLVDYTDKQISANNQWILSLMKSHKVLTGVTIAVVALGSAYFIYKKHQQEIIDLQNKANDALKKSYEEYGELTNSINDSYKTINDSNSSYEDNIQAHKDLYEVKSKLIELYGTEANSINLITDDIQKQTEALRELQLISNKRIYADFLRDINEETGTEKFVTSMVRVGGALRSIQTLGLSDLITSLTDGFNPYTDDVFTGHLDDIFAKYEQFSESISVTSDESLNNIIASYENVSRVGDKFEFAGNVEDVSNTILIINDLIKDNGSVTDKWKSSLDDVYNSASEIRDSLGETYKNALNYQIYSNSDSAILADSYASSVNRYIEAVSSGDSEFIRKATEEYNTALQNLLDSGELSQSAKDYIISINPQIDELSMERTKQLIEGYSADVVGYVRNEARVLGSQNAREAFDDFYKYWGRLYGEEALEELWSRKKDEYENKYGTADFQQFYDELSLFQKMMYELQNTPLTSEDILSSEPDSVFNLLLNSGELPGIKSLEDLVAVLRELNLIDTKQSWVDEILSVFGKETSGYIINQISTENGFEAWVKMIDSYGSDALYKMSLPEIKTAFAKVLREGITEGMADGVSQSSISTAVKNLNTQIQPQLSQLGSLFSSIFQYGEGGNNITGIDWSKLDISTVNSLRASFLELGEDIGFAFNEQYVNSFIDSLATETATVDSVREAFNDLATEYFYTTDLLEDLNDETAETIALTLRNQGVINSYDVANYNLAAEAMSELEDADNNLTATQISNIEGRINAYLSEIKVTEETAEALGVLQLRRYIFDQGGINTKDDVNSLLELAQSAGVAGKYLEELTNISALYDNYERVKNYSSSEADNIKRQIQERTANLSTLLADFKFELDIEVPSSASSSAGSAGKDAAETYVEEFEKELSVLEYLRTNGFIDEKEYLDQLRKLTEKYYKDKDQYAEQYYEKIHEYLEGIKSLYESAASAADDLLDKQITDYEELSEKATKTLEEQQEAAEKAIQDQIDAKQAELDLLNEANEKRQEELDLAKALYELERSKHQRTRLVNICQKLW